MPRTKITEKIVYKYNELTEEAKEHAMNRLTEDFLLDEWWENTYEDAEQAGLEIREFDLDYRSINGKLITDAADSIKYILENHGPDCETYKTAERFKKTLDSLDESSDDYEEQKEQFEENYLYAICEDYLTMLREEYAYQTSRKVIEETIEANEWEFDEHGNLA
jgi:hypothetical protein